MGEGEWAGQRGMRVDFGFNKTLWAPREEVERARENAREVTVAAPEVAVLRHDVMASGCVLKVEPIETGEREREE